MRRLNALAAAITITVVAAVCTKVGALTRRVTSTPHGSAMLPDGKYQASGIAFTDRETSFAAIAGYAGASTTLESWIERTTDGGRHWAAGRPASGQQQPAAQVGMAFVSAQRGWAYEPGMFFTRDGGVTWRAEHTRFRLVGPVAVAGASTWVA